MFDKLVGPETSWSVIIVGVALLSMALGALGCYSLMDKTPVPEPTVLLQDPDAQYPIPSIDWSGDYSRQLAWDLNEFGQRYPGYSEMIGIVQYQEHLFVTYIIQPIGVKNVAERRVVHFRYDEEVGDFIYDGEWREYVSIENERSKKGYDGVMPKGMSE